MQLFDAGRGKETEAEYGGGREGDDERKRRGKTGRNKHEETRRESHAGNGDGRSLVTMYW